MKGQTQSVRRPGSPTGLVCFDRADFFARHQVSIDYRTRAPFPAIPAVDPAKLPKTRKCLCEKKLLDIAFIGDSITDGWNSTEKVGVAPGQAPGRIGDGTAFPADLLPHGQRRGFRFRFGFRSGTS